MRISNWRAAAVSVHEHALDRLACSASSAPAGGDEPGEAARGRRPRPAPRSGVPRPPRACSRARARSTGSGSAISPAGPSTVMRSLECWTSEPKRASLRRRWISSVSAMLSSASATCVASARSAASTDGAGRAGGRDHEPLGRATARRDLDDRGQRRHRAARAARRSARRRPRPRAARGVRRRRRRRAAPSPSRRRAIAPSRPRRRGSPRGSAAPTSAAPRAREHPLARERALLLADQPGHAHDDEAEEGDRGARRRPPCRGRRAGCRARS